MEPANIDPGANDATDRDKKIRVLCVDDHRDIRATLQMLIGAEPDMLCVGCLESGNALVDQVKLLTPDVVLLDATMPGKDPFDALRELNAESLPVRSIVFTAWETTEILDRAHDAGAHGWVVKGGDPELIVQAIRKVAGGGTFFSSVV